MTKHVLFLDDDEQRVANFAQWFSRICPDSKVIWVSDSTTCIAYLQDEQQQFDLLCLDNDLGDDNLMGQGIDVAKWMERRVHVDNERVPTNVIIHTQNPVARKRIMDCLLSIKKKQEMLIDVQSFDTVLPR